MNPTPEQAEVVDQFLCGYPLVVEARAGTGKTSTLELVARATQHHGLYVAFNKAIVQDALARMPGNMACSTAHSLAYQQVGYQYRHRLDSARIKSQEMARVMGLQPLGNIRVNGTTKYLSAGYLAGVAMRAIGSFCQTADPAPTGDHVPYLRGIDDVVDGRPGWANNRAVRQHIAPALTRAWADLCDPDGKLRFTHDHYLKMWQLDEPRIDADFILFDEAQDANPVMKSIVEQQDHAQVLWVGDSCQAIYEWNGAVNALDRIDGAKRCWLTQSFRFGPAIAAMANRVLDALDASPGVIGLDTIDSTVGPLDDPDVILCRTNAAAVDTVLANLDHGRTVALVGGAQDVVTFAEAAVKLQNRQWTPHPELSCFESWPEVVEYVAQDQQGHELALLVKLIEEYGAERIIAALDQTIPEDAADVVVSTAHKAKGREWESVRLAADFPDAPDRPEELRLVYVAATRARQHLSAAAVPFFSQIHTRQEVLAP